MRPLKFCHITTFYPPYSFGGDAIYLHRLVNTLAARGHDVDVIHCVDSYKALTRKEPKQSFPNHPNVKVHGLRSGWGRLSPLVAQQTGRTWPKTNRILEVLYSKNFDVIHYHNISLFGPQVLRLEPDYRDFLKLYTTHEHWLVCPMHVLWKNNRSLCDKPQCLRCTLRFGRPPQWWRYTSLLEKSLDAVDAFLSPSQFTRNMHAERGFRHPMTVMPNFVPEQNLLPPADTSLPWARPYFLYVGRLELIKGVQTVLPLFRDYPHADLLIAGTGSYEMELRRQSRGIPRVHFLGALDSLQLQEFYRHAIAVIVPSLCYEVLPNVPLEVSQIGTPVIGRDLGGISEAVESTGGVLYHNSEELLTALENVRLNSALRNEIADRSHHAYSEKWSEEAHLKMYFQVLEETALRKWGIVPWRQQDPDSSAFPAPSNVKS
jgi:glycosyltransferase involved in cell wall biosynthesis